MLPQEFGVKRWLIQSLGIQKAGGNVFQILLDGLSTRELQVLRDHDDIVDQALEISKMSGGQLLEIIKEDYNLNPEKCHTGDVWIGTDQLEDRIPEWFKSQHCGWYMSFCEGQFDTWARNFLMQEVRINIWMRHLEELRKSPPKQGNMHTGYR